MKNKGITLITLVITIILLIILAGITINIGLGENGLFTRAKEARNKYLTAEREEEIALNELYKQLGIEEELPENTKNTEAGTIVKTPEKWKTTMPNYVDVQTGKQVKDSYKVASVYAVAVGNGNEIPVPLDFYYVGGTLESGIVISDNSEDRNKDAGKTDVRNQFVWIPCTVSDYHKINFGENTYDNAGWDRETNAIELPQIEKYAGFYIGRYEAGVGTLNKEKEQAGEANPFDYTVTFTGGASLFNSVGIQTGLINGWAWQNYNFTAKREGTPVNNVSNKATGNIVIKGDSIPYYHADYYTSVEMSRRMYENHKYVKSGLVTGTMWDMMMKYMQDNGINVKSTSWGNYDNTSLTNLSGYYTNVTPSGSNIGATDGFKSAKTLTTNSGTGSYVLLTTGSAETVKQMNLYDVAGNLWEWTTEAAYIKDLTYGGNINYNSYMLRGGGFYTAYATAPACYRAGTYAPRTYTCYGFRSALFLQ